MTEDKCKMCGRLRKIRKELKEKTDAIIDREIDSLKKLKKNDKKTNED